VTTTIASSAQDRPTAQRPSNVSLVLDQAGVAARQAAGEHAYGLQASEVLDHLRLGHTVLGSLEVPGAPGVSIVAEAPAEVGPEQVAGYEAWVRSGGVLVLTDRALALASLAGVSTIPHGNGLVSLDNESWNQPPARPLRAINGSALSPSAGDVTVLASWVDEAGHAGEAAITRRPLGDGEVICFGVDLWETVVRVLQGYPVHEDHAPAADGSAPMDEGILKCEDGMALEVDHDRAMPPGEPPLDGPYAFGYPPPYSPPIFDLPQADLWVAAFTQLVWEGLDRTSSGHGWLHYWPAGIPAMAHMSHDSDGNVTEEGQAALDAFDEAGVKVTWCQVHNVRSYDPHIYDAITAAGHEHALHYNAMGDTDLAQWGWEQIEGQYAWAQDVIRTDTKITSNKNHYTRWEGWTEFYGWCEQLGITIDESRGPSKLGTVGFPFGTAHVDFPLGDVTVGNRRMDVLNLPLHVQDLEWAGHIACRDVILDGALQVHGVAHFLFHGPHLLGKPKTRTACREVAEEGRARGMQWWTARQINTWERARRGVDVTVTPVGETEWTITVSSQDSLPGAGVVVTLPGSGDVKVATAEGTALPVAQVTRHGRTWYEITADIAPGSVSWKASRA